jgi:hypothetical protein
VQGGGDGGGEEEGGEHDQHQGQEHQQLLRRNTICNLTKPFVLNLSYRNVDAFLHLKNVFRFI